MEALPKDVDIFILMKIDIQSLAKFAVTSKYAKSLVAERKIWETLLQNEFPVTYANTKSCPAANFYQGFHKNLYKQLFEKLGKGFRAI